MGQPAVQATSERNARESIAIMAYSDPSDAKRYSQEHYWRNRHRYLERAKRHNTRAYKRNREFLLTYLKKHPCIDCGEDDPDKLQFDHVRGTKASEVTTIAGNACSIAKIRAEIRKCEVRCASCHQKVTKIRRREQAKPLDNTTETQEGDDSGQLSLFD